MEERLKQRLVGAIVLVSLAVVFVPLLLDVPDEAADEELSATPIPERPQGHFDSTVIVDLGEPETPRLDAELERERAERASGATAGVRPQPSDGQVPPSTPVSGAAGAPVVATAPMHEAVESAAPAAPAGQTGLPSARSEPPAPGPDDATAKKPPAEPIAEVGKQWAVQLGSFRRSGNAIALRKRLRDEGYSAFVRSSPSGRGEVFRVLVGPSTDLQQAKNSAAKLLLEMNLEGFVVPYSGG